MKEILPESGNLIIDYGDKAIIENGVVQYPLIAYTADLTQIRKNAAEL